MANRQFSLAILVQSTCICLVFLLWHSKIPQFVLVFTLFRFTLQPGSHQKHLVKGMPVSPGDRRGNYMSLKEIRVTPFGAWKIVFGNTYGVSFKMFAVFLSRSTFQRKEPINSKITTVKWRFFEPSRRMQVGLKNRVVRENRGTVK